MFSPNKSITLISFNLNKTKLAWKTKIPSLLNDKWLLSLSSFLPTKLNDNETSIELSISKKLIILN